MSKFFCDSNCELDYKRFDELGIDCLIKMPYTVNGEESAYDLGRSGTSKEFFDKMRAGAVVKTQALNQINYIEYFEPVLAGGDDILYVTFTHKMSATFESMKAAIEELKEKYPDRKITWVDSKGISMAAGMVVYYAAKMHNEGKSDEEVVAFVESFREKVKTYFTVEDLVYLKRGGRLSSFKALMGTILNLKPIITIEDGALVSNEKANGRKKALHTLLDKLSVDGIDTNYPLIIVDADSKDDAILVKEMALEKYPDIAIWNIDVGPVIGCHCGPGTVGLMFVKK